MDIKERAEKAVELKNSDMIIGESDVSALPEIKGENNYE